MHIPLCVVLYCSILLHRNYQFSYSMPCPELLPYFFLIVIRTRNGGAKFFDSIANLAASDARGTPNVINHRQRNAWFGSWQKYPKLYMIGEAKYELKDIFIMSFFDKNFSREFFSFCHEGLSVRRRRMIWYAWHWIPPSRRTDSLYWQIWIQGQFTGNVGMTYLKIQNDNRIQ